MIAEELYHIELKWTSEADRPKVIEGLKTGVEYTLLETVAPMGYTVATATTFSIDADGTVTTSGSETDDGILLINDAKTKVSISKVDVTSQKEVVGAHIQILDQDGNVAKIDGVNQEWDSDGTPHYVEGLMTGVTYRLHETIAPSGYTIAADTEFTIDEAGKVTSRGTEIEDGCLLVEDAMTEVMVSKVDAGAGKELPGAHIQVIDSKGEIVEQWDSVLDSVETEDVNEAVHVIHGLKTGVTYTLRETVAPDGYAVAADTTFVIAADGTVTTTASRNGQGVLLVEDDLTRVRVSKVDVAGGNEVQGAKIQVLGPDGKVATIDGRPVEWTSGKTAHEIVGLKPGETYTLRETVAPDGYAVATDIEFSIDERGRVTTGARTTQDGTILIEDAKTKIIVSKRDIASGAEIAGAQLQVIKTDTGGSESIVENWTSVAGESYTIEGLHTDTEYVLRETTAPDGYAITTDVTFTIDDTGKVTTAGKKETDKDGNTVLVVDDAMTKVTVSKTDITGEEEIPGAHIELFDDAGNPVLVGGKAVAWTSNGAPHEIFGLKGGKTYVLRETTAPDGYTIAADTTFTLAVDGKVMVGGKQVSGGHILINDALSKVLVSKRDVTGEDELAGAKIQILDADGDVVETVKGEKLEWTSGNEPKAIEGLKANVTYTLHEVTAPDGYTIAADTAFSIDENGRVRTNGAKTTDAAGNSVLLVNDSKTVVRVTKREIAGGPEIAGARISVLDDKGSEVHRWTSAVDDAKTEKDEAIHEIVGLKTGVTYTLRETVAPDGYTIATDTTFTIDKNGNVRTSGTMTEGGAILVEDAPTRVSVSKVAVGGADELAGATIQVVDAETGKVAEIAGEKVEWISGVEAHEIVGLTAGKKYLLRETVAPKGYVLLTTDIAFSIDVTGKVTTTAKTTKDGVILVEDDITTVAVSKRVATGGDEELAGAHIRIVDAETGKVAKDLDGKNVEWVSTDEEHTVVGLEAGRTYILRETVAPEGSPSPPTPPSRLPRMAP